MLCGAPPPAGTTANESIATRFPGWRYAEAPLPTGDSATAGPGVPVVAEGAAFIPC